MIYEKFKKYEEMSRRIIDEIKLENNTIYLMDEREAIIIDICSTEKKDEIKKIYFELGLNLLDLELKTKIEEEMALTKKEIDNVQRRKNASRGYANVTRLSNTFSTKI
ncbi:MAG: hypothetical protein ACRC2K_09405 [Clostridium sp.]